MALTGLIGETVYFIQGVYRMAVIVHNEKKLYEEIAERAGYISEDLIFFENLLNRLKNYASQLTVDDEMFLTDGINAVRSAVENIQNVLTDVLKNRNIFQKLLSNKAEMQTKLENGYTRLHDLCHRVENFIHILDRIIPELRPMPDFKRQLAKTPKKDVSFFDFIIDEHTPKLILSIATEEFNSNNCVCYMKVNQEKFFVSYQLRTWLGAHPQNLILKDRIAKFAPKFNQNKMNDLYPVLSQGASLSTVSNTPIRTDLKFSEYYMANDNICGLEMSETNMYIATKYNIIIIRLKTKETRAQYGREGDGPNRFKQISSILIPADDKQSLYIVDRGQYRVYKYRIDDGDRFEYVRDYKVIPNHNQRCHLVSCAIFKNRLYVTDKANNCLHIFPLDAERQSHCLKDNSIQPFSPGSICAYENYLYVANCSSSNPMILIFNVDCEPVYWYRHDSLNEILTMYMDQNLGELYVLTRTTVKSAKQPLIVSMGLFRTPDANSN